jgi:hypothetical protein
MTTAAARFLEAVSQSWDSREPWENTAKLGLSEVDSDALSSICDKTGDEYGPSEAAVLAAVRAKLAREIYQECTGSWSGCDWTATHGQWKVDIDGLDSTELRRLADVFRRRTETSEDWEAVAAMHIPPRNDDRDDEDYLSRREFCEQISEFCETAAGWLEECAANAAHAEEEASEAMVAIEAGNLSDALYHAEKACHYESIYGDDPTWGRFRKLLASFIAS